MNGVLWTVEKGGVGRRRGARAEGFESAGTWKQPRPGWTVASGRKQQPLAFFPRSCSTLDETACLGVGRIPTQKPEGEGGGGLGLGFVGVGVGASIVGSSGSQDVLFLGPSLRRVEASVSPTPKRNGHNQRCDSESSHHRGPGLLQEWHPAPLTTDWKDPFILVRRPCCMLINAVEPTGQQTPFLGLKHGRNMDQRLSR